MKLKLLDERNCQALLPPIHGIRLDRLLEEYLRSYVNEIGGKMNGSVDALISHNRRTFNTKRGTQRLCNSPIEIALIYNVAKQGLDMKGLIKPMGGPANFHTILELSNGITWKTIIPLQFLLKGWGDANHGHQCYVHSISNNISQIKSLADMHAREVTASDDYSYVGITGRNWLHRFSEHMGEIGRGSRKRFHQAWHNSMGKEDVHLVSHLVNVNLKKDDAMNWEEYYVDRIPNALNMISGGYKGLRELHEHRIIGSTDISFEERDRAIEKYVRRNPRKGIPNPFIAELWKNDEHYLKVIESRPKTLTPEQVRKIREYAYAGLSVTEITEKVDALNDTQVKNVIAGKTYKRIKCM